MGLAISNLSQRVLAVAPSLEEVGGKPDIAVLSVGQGRRHTFFSRLFDGDANVRVLTCQKAPNTKLPKAVSPISTVPSIFDCVTAAAREGVPGTTNALKFFVDVSCLPRTTIAHVFAAVAAIAQARPVDLNLAYSLAVYAPSPTDWASANRSICPVHPQFSGWTSEGASAPLDVVVGLGYEKGKALGAVEYLEPRHRWIYVPESPEDKYLSEVRNHNKDLINSNQGRTSHYQVLSPVDTYFNLRSLVEGIAREARPVLLPFGPKLFFAINLLVAMTVDEAAVWHVNGESDDYGERRPSRHSAIMSCTVGGSVLRT